MVGLFITYKVSVLFLIGNGFEKEEIIKDMLDIENYKNKPSYEMASENPLILYDCGFEDVNWEYEMNFKKLNFIENNLEKNWKNNVFNLIMINNIHNQFLNSLILKKNFQNITGKNDFELDIENKDSYLWSEIKFNYEKNIKKRKHVEFSNRINERNNDHSVQKKFKKN
jgi:hypothetical protein